MDILNDRLFTDDEKMRLRARHHEFAIAKAVILTVLCMAGLQFIGLCAVGWLEYEVVFRVFSYLATDAGYWSPHLMAGASFVMIAGFHMLAQHDSQNFAVRLVGKAVGILIPAYLFGVGIFVAAILLDGTLGDLLGSDEIGGFGQLPELGEKSLLETFFSNITNPVAVVLFSLGIGGLAVVNVFVAHKLIEMMMGNIHDITGKISFASEADALMQKIEIAEQAYETTKRDLADLSLKDEVFLRLKIVADVLGVIGEALLPHMDMLKHCEYEAPKTLFSALEDEPSINVDPNKLKKDITRIEAITQADILSALNPYQLEQQS